MRNATELDKILFQEILADNQAAFVFDEEKFRLNLRSIHEAFSEHFPKVRIGYSYKTNYTPTVCLIAHSEGALAEVVSEMEVDMALMHLNDKSQIIYNGPVKSRRSLKKVIAVNGIINVDNSVDVDQITDILKENQSMSANLAFRVNVDYKNDDSRFGQSTTSILRQVSRLKHNRQVNIVGFHIHLPHRTLDSFKHRVEELIKIIECIDLPQINYINIGGGFFGHLSPDLKHALNIAHAPSFGDYGRLIGERLFDYFKEKDNQNMPTLYLEPGSSVIADCFTFISRIHSKKSFENRELLVSFAGRHLLSPTNKKVKLPCEIVSIFETDQSVSTARSLYEVVGYTCIESDRISLVEGQSVINTNAVFLEFTNVGSYSIVMGSNFILPEPPIFSLGAANRLTLLRGESSAKEIVNRFS